MSIKERVLSWLGELPDDDPIWSELRSRSESRNRPTGMNPPPDVSLPFFSYGALKPGMPAHKQLSNLIEEIPKDVVCGELWVRDGLPLLRLNGCGETAGFLLRWKDEVKDEGYRLVCEFEPPSHYQWSEVDLISGNRANALVMRFETKGNPEPLHKRTWNLQDDAAFGAGLDTVERVLKEVDAMPQGNDFEDVLAGFFRSQMA